MSIAPHLPLRRPLAARALGTPLVALGLLALASVVVRLAAGGARTTQHYLPDEFMYGQLARSLAEGHGWTVLGDPSRFPAFLQPLLTAPAWLPGDPALALRLTQGLNAVAMALAVVPVWLLARRLGLRERTALLLAAAAVALPDLVYVGYATSDALGYLLALVAIERAVAALDRPSRRAWVVTAVTVGLATCARAQYAALVVAVALAAIVADGARLRRLLSPVRIVLGGVGAVVLGVAAWRVLGPYATVTGFRPDAATAMWVPRTGFLLALATGAAVVPGCVAFLAHAVVGRNASRSRRALGAVTVALGAMLVLASAAMSAETASERFFERYLMVLVPLALVAFACWLEEGRPWSRLAWLVAAGLAVAAPLVPVATYAAGQGRADSPFLLAVERLEHVTGVGTASLVVAAAATAALALGLLGGRAALPATLAVFAAVSIGAHAADRALSDATRAELGARPDWVDATGLHDVAMLQSADASTGASMALTLANRAITRAGVLPGAQAVPGISSRASVRPDGTVRLAGASLAAVVVAAPETTLLPAPGTTRLVEAGFTLLSTPAGEVRVAAVAKGLAPDGGLGRVATVDVHPGPTGACRAAVLTVHAPAGRPLRLAVSGSSRRASVVRLAPGEAVALRVVARRSVARLALRAQGVAVAMVDGERPVVARATLRLTGSRCDAIVP